MVSLYNMSYFCQGWLETKTPRPLTTLLAPPTQCLAESPATLLRFLLRLGYLLPFCPAGVLSSAVFSLSRVSHDLGLPSSEGCPETWTPAPRQTVLGTPGWPVTWLPILPEPFHSSSWLHLIPTTTSAQTTQARNLGVIILHFSLATELPNFVSSPSQVILDSMPSKFLDWTISIPSVNSFLSPFSHSLSSRLPRWRFKNANQVMPSVKLYWAATSCSTPWGQTSGQSSQSFYPFRICTVEKRKTINQQVNMSDGSKSTGAKD